VYPVLLEVQGFPIRSYGVALVLAFAVGIAVAYHRGRRAGLDGEGILDVCMVILVSSLAGSRLLYALTHPGLDRESGYGLVGMSMMGGVALATVCALLFLWAKHMPVLATADVLAPSVALGEGITRIGCFLNGCCRGLPCTQPFCVRFPDASEAVHPTQLYTSIGAFAVAGLLFALARRKPRSGLVFSAFLIAVGAGRALVDLVRYYEPEDLLSAGFSVHQALAAAFLVTGLAVLLQTLRVDSRISH